MSPFATKAKMAAAGGGGGAAEFFVGSFTANTSTGSQAVTGVGFTPKALIFFMSGSSAASGTFQAKIHQTIGFTSGAAESYSVSGASDDAVTTSNTGRRIAAKCITIIDVDGATVVGEADLTTFDPDGFTLDWTDAPAAADEIMFLAIGGADVEAKVVNWTSPTATGNKAVTGVGFTPSVVLHAGTDIASAPPTSDSQMSVSLGCMDSSGNEWSIAVDSQNGVGTSNTNRYQVTTKCYTTLLLGSIQEQSEFVSMDSDGFTTNFTTADPSGGQVISLCLSGVSATAGSFTSPTTATTKAVTGVGFTPSVVMVATRTSTSGSTVLTHNSFTLGAYDGTNERAAGHYDTDAQTTTIADSVWLNTKPIFALGSGSSTFEEADVQSFDSDGFTTDFTKASASAIEYVYLALA